MDEKNYFLFLKQYRNMVWSTSLLLREKNKDNKVTKEVPFLLHVINNCGPITQRQLAEKLKIKPSTLSVRLQRLEDLNLIERQNDLQDKRIQNVIISKEGKAVLDEVMQALLEIMQLSFKDFSEEEIKMLISYIERISINIQKGIEDYD